MLTLLADLQKKVLLDGEVEQKQYEKFGEWRAAGRAVARFAVCTPGAPHRAAR